MTYKEVTNMIQSMGLPCVYYEFPQNTAQAPPFICFYYPESDDFYADNGNYVGITRLNVELYTDEKDFDLEKTVETVLKQHGFSYQKTETPIPSEKMWMELYEMEVLINE